MLLEKLSETNFTYCPNVHCLCTYILVNLYDSLNFTCVPFSALKVVLLLCKALKSVGQFVSTLVLLKSNVLSL
jgi:hypothetical protein